ncbi:MAG: disulfide bond formation protein DsbA [Aerococcus viridans]|nr:MAG: disulfide bond formation protein DsbA [Aerococcus viridans]
MEITIWSDFVCPFCYIGQTHLERAMENFEHADEITISHKSFELMPGAKHDPSKDFYQSFADLKGTTYEQAKQMNDQVAEMAERTGLHFKVDQMKMADTMPAHRVFQYAKSENKDDAYFKAFYHAYFENGALISDEDTIVTLAESVGLDGQTVREILADEDKFKAETNLDIFQAGQVGVQGVPFFVFDNKYAVSGAQPVEVFQQVLDQVYANEQAEA